MAEYRVPTQQELIKDGKDLGLAGAELQAYVKAEKQEAEARELKAEKAKQEAKAEKEKQEAKAKQDAEAKELKAEKAKQEAEAKAEKAKQEAEAKAEKARLEMERKDKDTRERDGRAMAREATRRKEEMDEKEREREFAAAEKDKERQFQMERDRADKDAKAELARIEAEKMRYEAEQKAELARIEGANAADKMRFEISEKEKDRQLEENKIRLEREKLDAGTTRGGDDTERRTGDRTVARGPKIAVWNDKEDMDGYLKKFENIARHNRWDRGSWATFLSGVLTGKATDVLTRMPVEDVNDYDLVKAELLKRFNKTEEGFKQKFFSSKAETDESPQQYLAR
jgi:hypothetical protein